MCELREQKLQPRILDAGRRVLLFYNLASAPASITFLTNIFTAFALTRETKLRKNNNYMYNNYNPTNTTYLSFSSSLLSTSNSGRSKTGRWKVIISDMAARGGGGGGGGVVVCNDE